MIGGLPDDTPCGLILWSGDSTLGELRDRLGVTEPEVVDVAWAAENFPAYTARQIRGWAASGEISGAWQEAAGGKWRFTLKALRVKVYQNARPETEEFKPRGPIRKTA